MSQRVRGQEVTIQVVVDGVVQTGSFAKVEDFKLTPREDLVETDFIGEVTTDLDIQHHGYDFSFSTHQQDGKIMDLLLKIVAKEETHTPHPAINLVVTYRYRDLSTPSETMVLQSCFMKLNDHAFSTRKDYVKNSFEGKCKTVARV